MDRSLLVADGIGHDFGTVTVLDGVSFTLGRGDCLLLLGQNGAGKTTLLGILSGKMRPTRGSVTLNGIRVAPGSPRTHELTGVVGHEPMLHTGLTVRENLAWFAAMVGDPSPEARTDALLKRFRLGSHADAEVRTLSRGQQQRAGLARAMVSDPALLLLDEPFTGLDEPARDSLAADLRNLRAAGTSVILTTHETAVGLASATHVALLSGHRLTGPADVADQPAVSRMLAELSGTATFQNRP